LPFVPKPALFTWRDDLADQLRPGATVNTLEVFAARAGVSQQSFKNLLDADSEMDCQVFSHTPRLVLRQYREQVLHENCNLLVKTL
jgi:hypothetical protein